MNPRKFKKGDHVYVDWGKGVKEVKKVSENKKKEKKGVKIKIDEDTSRGNYANLGYISHTQNEFMMDFIFKAPGMNQAKVVSRIISSPSHAKRLLGALAENVKRYEKKYGTIKQTSEKDSSDKKIGFN